MEQDSNEFKKYKVSKNRDEIEAEHVMAEANLDDDYGEFEFSLGGARIWSLGVFIILALLVFLGKTAYLQVIRGAIYQNEALENKIKKIPVEAPRGIIFSRDGRQLVSNSAVFDLAAAQKTFPKSEAGRNEIIKNLKDLQGAYSNGEALKEISDAILNFNLDKSSLILYKDIPREIALAIEANSEKFLGVEVLRGISRFYIEKDIMAHILGYLGLVSKDDLKKGSQYLPTQVIGKSGVELVYEDLLKGELGVQLVETDSSGAKKENLALKEPEPGRDLIISIDFDLQKFIYNVLKIRAFESESDKACAVAMNPKNGEILALVNLPSFDNNVFSGNINKGEYDKLILDKNKPLFNRVISGEYPPGSTIKPVVGIAALEENVVSRNTVIQDNGVITIVNQYNPGVVYNFFGWNRSGLGPMDIFSAIAQSSDIFFYTAGGGNGDFSGLGVDKLNSYFKKFGMGEKLLIDLPGESAGLVPDPQWKKKIKNEDWFLGDTYHISIGQGDLLATPLQVAGWTAAIANGGVLMKPHLGIFEVEPNGDKKAVEAEVLRKLDLESKNLEIIKEAMRKSVLEGSAKSLANLPVEIAGKTGTAEFGGQDQTHAWFTCFAPFNNPEIVLVILVEGGGGGSDVAVPIAKEILEFWADKYF
ncbi:MAG: penicillin-binding protein 2 [bacterium]